MKKSFFYAICVMVLATMVAVVSCKKEKEPQVEAEVPQADAQMQAEIDRIVGFKKQVETRKANPGMKSAETMTLDEAMNNIVDLFNVTYTEPMAYYTESERHEFTLSVALTADGKVLLDDVVAAYEQALANAREAYHGSNLPDKAYQFLTVTCTPQRDGTAELKFDGQYGSKEYNIYKVIPDTLGISLEAQNNVVPPSRYYVIDVVINGEESSNPSFIRHNTHVKYGRYNFVNENTIGQQPL